MPEIEVTEDQLEYLQAVREDIQTEIVGKYGHVRLQDALQYLIDSHEGDGDLAVGAGSGAEAESDPATEAVEVEIQDDAEDARDPGDDEDDADAAAGDAATESDESTAEDAAPEDDESEAEADEEPDDDDDMLDAMMQLLETHDDKWREADGEARYEVDLPDGGTETANTKDDVRALLFQHYG